MSDKNPDFSGNKVQGFKVASIRF